MKEPKEIEHQSMYVLYIPMFSKCIYLMFYNCSGNVYKINMRYLGNHAEDRLHAKSRSAVRVTRDLPRETNRCRRRSVFMGGHNNIWYRTTMPTFARVIGKTPAMIMSVKDMRIKQGNARGRRTCQLPAYQAGNPRHIQPFTSRYQAHGIINNNCRIIGGCTRVPLDVSCRRINFSRRGTALSRSAPRCASYSARDPWIMNNADDRRLPAEPRKRRLKVLNATHSMRGVFESTPRNLSPCVPLRELFTTCYSLGVR